MSQPKYSVTIMRHTDNDEVTELVDKWITADQAIELLVKAQEMAEYTIQVHHEDEFKDYTPVHHEEEPEKKEELPDNIAKLKKHTGRKASYDKDAVKKDIKAGIKPGDIATKYGITAATVYQIKSKMKNEEDEEEQPESDDVPVDNHPKARVKRMVAAGETDQAIYNVMHDFMTDEQFREAIAEARS